MLPLEELINLNLIENQGGNVLEEEHYNLSKYTFLKDQYTGFNDVVKYASKVLCRKDENPNIHFLFSDKNELNAYVSRLRMSESNDYLIVCYSGIYTSLFNLFIWFMTFDSILINVPRKRKNDLGSELLNDHYVHNKRINLQNLSTPFVLVGSRTIDSVINDKRNEYALLLTSYAIEFLFYHELTHIEHGHIDYLKSKNIAFETLFSSDKKNEILFNNSDKQKALEFEADIGSAEYLFTSYWDLNYKGTLMRKFDHLLTKREELMFSIFFSLIWLFHLMHEYRLINNEQITNCHPTPSARILSVYGIFDVFGGKSKEENGLELVQNQFREAAYEYLKICYSLNIEPYIRDTLFEKNSPESEEITQIEDFRNSILKEMTPFHYSRTSVKEN